MVKFDNKGGVFFDDILDKKLKFGRYQFFALLIVALVDMNDGVELVLMPIITPLIKKEFGLVMSQVEQLTSIFYLGMFLGSIVTGRLADRRGRRPALIIASSIQFLTSITFSLVKSYEQMMFMRFLYGVCFGFSVPLTTSMISEISPLIYRGKLLIIINFFMSIGKLYGCMLAAIFLDSFDEGNWRRLMIVSAFPCLITLAGTLFYLMESPRFYLAHGRFDEAVVTIRHMERINNRFNDPERQITEQDLKGLRIWMESSTLTKEEKGSIKVLFDSKYKRITIRMLIMWFFINFMYYGQLAILPFILHQDRKGIRKFVYTVLGEIPSIFFTMLVVDMKNMGRKNSLFLSYFICGLINSFAYIFDKTNVSLFFSTSRFFMKNCFAFLYAITTESFPTHVRTLGYGFNSAVGRLGSFFMPYILFPLYDKDNYSSFYLFAITSFISCVACITLPYDTMAVKLDHYHEEEEKSLEMRKSLLDDGTLSEIN